MLTHTLLLISQLLPSQAPALADTTRQFRGAMSNSYAWGTLMLQDGQRLQGYLPTTATGLLLVVPYYSQPPDAQGRPKPKTYSVRKVRWMRVRGQYSELMMLGPQDKSPLLAAQRQAGAVELFLTQLTLSPLVTAFLGPTPTTGIPAAGPAGLSAAQWYLRRPGGSPMQVSISGFAAQVAEFLADDRALAAKVAAGAAGYQFADLESIVRQYNQQHR